MFTATLFTIAKTWKRPKGPLTDDWIRKCGIYTVEYYSAIKKQKRQPTEWEKIVANDATDKGLISTSLNGYH